MDILDFLLTLAALTVVLLIVGAVLARFLNDIVAYIVERWLDVEAKRAQVQEVWAKAHEASENVMLVTPSSNGALPISRKLLESGQIVDAQLTLMAQDIDTRKPVNPVPHTMTYAPHFARTVNGIENLDTPESAASFTTPPTFTDLFRSGIINKNDFILGYTQEGQPMHGDIGDVYSNLIIAKSGGGKTTLQRFLLAQAAMKGAKIWVADPHGLTAQGMVSALKPLEKYFASKPAVEDEDIRDMVRHFVSMGEARIKGRDKDEGIQILAVDELNDIALYNDDGEEIVGSLIRSARAYRKVNMFVFASAQSANADDLGGTAGIRKSFVGRYVLKSDKDQVSKLIPDKDLLNMVPMLEPGRSIFVPTKGAPVALSIPNTTIQDLEWCFGASGSSEVEQVRSQVQLPTFVVADEPITEPVSEPLGEPVTEPLSIRETQVRKMFLDGAGVDQMIREIWDVQGKGEAYQKAKAELYEILRSLIK